MSSDIPQKVKICETEMHVKLQDNIQGVVNDKAQGKLNIENLICHTNENTGFLIWLYLEIIACLASFKKHQLKICHTHC